MSSTDRWHVVPRSRVVSVCLLIAGVLTLISSGSQLADGVAALPLVAAVLAVVVIGFSLVGLVRSPAR
ncbi:hypothetical protein [Streptomyces sp. Z26]|uniref:hypothetical protein n=1 Tax=Streptomyces TaxID=1883 RepID=UPI000EF156D8|nr:hypothetical protein [Streptomyces sp. Z26]RLL65589.1 hypothetical protein D7M15_00270 [Streptomyces sp. Z26]